MLFIESKTIASFRVNILYYCIKLNNRNFSEMTCQANLSPTTFCSLVSIVNILLKYRANMCCPWCIETSNIIVDYIVVQKKAAVTMLAIMVKVYCCLYWLKEVTFEVQVVLE